MTQEELKQLIDAVRTSFKIYKNTEEVYEGKEVPEEKKAAYQRILNLVPGLHDGKAFENERVLSDYADAKIGEARYIRNLKERQPLFISHYMKNDEEYEAAKKEAVAARDKGNNLERELDQTDDEISLKKEECKEALSHYDEESTPEDQEALAPYYEAVKAQDDLISRIKKNVLEDIEASLEECVKSMDASEGKCFKKGIDPSNINSDLYQEYFNKMEALMEVSHSLENAKKLYQEALESGNEKNQKYYGNAVEAYTKVFNDNADQFDEFRESVDPDQDDYLRSAFEYQSFLHQKYGVLDDIKEYEEAKKPYEAKINEYKKAHPTKTMKEKENELKALLDKKASLSKEHEKATSEARDKESRVTSIVYARMDAICEPLEQLAEDVKAFKEINDCMKNRTPVLTKANVLSAMGAVKAAYDYYKEGHGILRGITKHIKGTSAYEDYKDYKTVRKTFDQMIGNKMNPSDIDRYLDGGSFEDFEEAVTEAFPKASKKAASVSKKSVSIEVKSENENSSLEKMNVKPSPSPDLEMELN